MREEGWEEGLREGVEMGLEQGLRAAVHDIASLLNLPMSSAWLAKLSSMNGEQLRELIEHLKNQKEWPL